MWKEIQLIKITLISPLLEFSIRCHNCHPPKLELIISVTQHLIYDVQLASSFRKLTGTKLFLLLCLLSREEEFSPFCFHEDSRCNKHTWEQTCHDAFTGQWDPDVKRSLTLHPFCKSNLNLLHSIGCISKVSHTDAKRYKYFWGLKCVL